MIKSLLKIIVALLACTCPYFSVQAQNTRVSATLTVTNGSGTTNGQTLSIAAQNLIFTNDPALNPSIYVTNGGQNVTATNIYLHVIAYPPSTSVTNVMTATNQIRIDGTINAPLSVTPSAGWATVTYVTNSVSGTRTYAVRVPFIVEVETNRTNIAQSLMTNLAVFAVTPPVTNGSNLATSNATVKPVYLGAAGSQMSFLSFEAGGGVSLSMTATSVVVSAIDSGITNLNTLTNRLQYFTATATGTDFSITTRSSTNAGTNVFDLPLASSTSTGKLSKGDWTTFNLKQPPSTTLSNLSTTGAHTNAAVLLYRGPTNSGIGAPLILKAGTGITMATNGTNFTISGSASSVPVFTNRITRWFIANGTTNLQGIGDTISTQTIASVIDPNDGGGNLNNGAAIQFQTTASTNGFAGSKLYHQLWSPLLTCRTMRETSGADVESWIGFTDGTFANMITSDPVSLNVAAFRTWDTNGNFFAYTSDTSSSEMNDTGIASDSEWHVFQVKINLAAVNVVFYIDGVSVRTNSLVVPQDVPLRPIVVRDNTLSPGAVMRFEFLSVESDR